MQFSMNPDPASWVELEDGELAFDQYPDGSFQFRIARLDREKHPQVVWLKSTLPAAVMAAAQVVDALDGMNDDYFEITLVVQTVPDQRGDKQGKYGACISARVTANLLGAIWQADRVIVHDVHSVRTLGLLDDAITGELIHIPSLECFKYLDLEIKPHSYVVAVDKGAVDRAETWAAEYGASVIYADKARDADGKITGHEITRGGEDFRDAADIWVVDDLCDGGATFISIAKALREAFPTAGSLHLYVTHGLFSKGVSELLKHFDTVNSLFDYSEWRIPTPVAAAPLFDYANWRDPTTPSRPDE